MALTLTVDLVRWRAHLDAAVAARPGLVPVIKGNGYGFGRARLLAECDRLGRHEVAVGTVWELAGVAAGRPVMVLTPCASPSDAAALTPDAVATVGSDHDVAVLAAAGWRGAVLVKLRTSLGRYGVGPDGLADLLRRVDGAGLRRRGFGVHFPLDGTAAEHRAELAAWLALLPAGSEVQVGHLGPDDLAALAAGGAGGEGAGPGAGADHTLRPRHGTALWLGDRDALRLTADVVDVRPVRGGERVGYRQVAVPSDGHLVLVAAGTAHGVSALDDGRSPFHHARTRLALVEPPHMHTSMCHVPSGDPLPAPGDRVDVQRPLTRTNVDRVEERSGPSR